MQSCFSIIIAGLPIELEQRANGTFRVTYFKQVEDDLNYAEAAKALGENILHALALDGKLDSSVD